MKTYLIIFLTVLAYNLQAQSASKILKPHFKKIQKAKASQLSKAQMLTLTKNADVFQALGAYTRSDKDQVQREGVRLTAWIGQRHQGAGQRKTAVHLLLEVAKTAESTVQYQVAKALQRFRQDDFDELARKLLAEHLQRKPQHLDKFLLTAGFLGMQDELEALRPEFKKRNSLRRSLNLALTRCGNQQKIESMMNNVRKIPVDDDFVYEVVPMLVYTRQRPQMDYLMELVLSNRRACRPIGEDVDGYILCGYRVIEQIAPVIEDFPVAVNELTGDLAVKDYKKAMKDVRTWLEDHKDTYVLKENIF
ncbi:MAG: hypothetical protein AAF990_06470 [Bacteroidota bacterium]